jgi:Flp pilus assembly protein TadG
MRNMLHCRRGAAAFATVIALLPLIGVVSLGAEAASWYVTRQHAQNAADAAAYSGALRLACTLGGACTDTQSVDYRGREFAAQNAFCATADATAYPGSQCAVSLPSGVSQAVAIAIGNYSGGTFTTPPAGNGNAVRATVSQQQPGYLAAVLGLTTVNIPAQAIALIMNPNNVCGLGLGRYVSGGSPSNSLTIGGNAQFVGNGCGLMSDNTVKFNSSASFSGTGWAVDAVNGCQGTSCSSLSVPYNYYSPYAENPLSVLDSESFNTATSSGNLRACPQAYSTCTIAPNTPTTAYNRNLTVTTGNTVTFTTGGTYFFYNANITINGGTVTGTSINIVLLGNSSLSISGGASVNLSANMNNTTYPDLSGVLIDDQAPHSASNAVTVNGNSGTVTLGGAMYFPNVDVTWSGTSANSATACTEVIANSLTMTGNAYMSSAACPANVVPHTQVVALVQ